MGVDSEDLTYGRVVYIQVVVFPRVCPINYITMSAREPTAVPPVLLPEILEFSPQLLLDDIINFANEAITNAVDGLEEFLFRWAADREQRVHEDWDSTQEVEQGLVAFQTLLEYHTDIAFDFFETWSLRNIFAIPADLPLVVPHQEDLVLNHPAELETDLMAEIQDLRKKIAAVRTFVGDNSCSQRLIIATPPETRLFTVNEDICGQGAKARKDTISIVISPGSPSTRPRPVR